MTAPLPASVADRLGKLIPRLATDHDGEIVATVHAIRRTLQSAGRDLHDLAARLASERPRSSPRHRSRTYEPPRPQPGPWRWSRLNSGERVMGLDMIRDCLRLSPWEAQFVQSIDDILRRRPSADLSPRQVSILNDLLHRAEEANR